MTTLRDILHDMAIQVLHAEHEALAEGETLDDGAVNSIVDETIDDVVKRIVGKVEAS